MTIETFTGECKHYTAKGAKDAKENQNLKPTTLRRTSGQATALRHGEKPEKTSCTAEARRRGEEFNFDEKFAPKNEEIWD